MNSVLIVDDHPVARLAVRILLEKEGMNVVAETGDGIEAVYLIKQHHPDLVVIDIDIPSMNGIDVVNRLRANRYDGAMLVLSGKDDEHYIKRCAGAGADGFISKKNQPTELHDAVRALRSGYSYFPRHLTRNDVASSSEKGEQDKLADLSAKELQVLHYLAKGEKIISISELMNISDKTVSTYKRRLMEKLNLNNMLEFYDFVKRNSLD
ncbi:putative two-component response regulator [Acinetobacter guillouiae]|uniref:response regulator n=1 Tax=Acinetobacter guillouiae TaxID=106649 RepID=UPI0004EF6577|nr:response regulator [Acinetobacter guillouiae]BAP36420.1 putative two-component response regulator [Acinetobacter guillouiae]